MTALSQKTKKNKKIQEVIEQLSGSWLDSPSAQFNDFFQNPDPYNPLKKIIKPVFIGGVRLPNNLVLAPMAGVTNGSFRLLCARLGAGFTVSELASAKAIIMENRQTIEMLKFQGQSRPYAAQIFGSDPGEMARAAEIIQAENLCDIIDINMGCPVPKVVKTGAGSALMKTPELAAEIVQKVKAAVKIPVTIKCRIGWSESDICVKDYVKRMLDAGAQAITVHARTRQAGYSGTAQWHHLEGLSEICESVPFFANGDITSPSDIEELYDLTACDGFMIGRGCVGYPWLFSELLGHNFFDSAEIQFKIFRHHLIDMIMEYGPKAVPLFRTHLFGYLKNHPNAAKARRILSEERDPKIVLATGEAFFKGKKLPGIETNGS
jgi:tRNA-dihydrouridine synthase B